MARNIKWKQIDWSLKSRKMNFDFYDHNYINTANHVWTFIRHSSVHLLPPQSRLVSKSVISPRLSPVLYSTQSLAMGADNISSVRPNESHSAIACGATERHKSAATRPTSFPVPAGSRPEVARNPRSCSTQEMTYRWWSWGGRKMGMREYQHYSTPSAEFRASRLHLCSGNKEGIWGYKILDTTKPRFPLVNPPWLH